MAEQISFHAAQRAQHRAADPGRSTWVSANAGSGKTRVLTERVARLMLHGADPQSILCLTFTKAAAAEMQNRLYKQLGRWVLLPEERLREALIALGEPEPELSTDRLKQARQLFAKALETPGGLKIQTIHAFCTALLRQFPIEAGLSPGFIALEEPQIKEQREQLLTRFYETHPDIFDALATTHGTFQWDSLIGEILQNRSYFEAPLDRDDLVRSLGADPGLTFAKGVERALGDGGGALLSRVFTAMDLYGSAAEKRTLALLQSAIRSEEPETIWASLENWMLYKGAKGLVPRPAKLGKIPNEPVRKALSPDDLTAFDLMMERVEVVHDQHAANDVLERTFLLHHAGAALAALWRSEVTAKGMLDFDDLIEITRRLLLDQPARDWVLYKLDGGISHILVDEAQDTNPTQWDVIGALAEEFVSGDDMMDKARTLFVVGDEKQSIYSFQGADPQAFGHMKAHFATRLEAIGTPLHSSSLAFSFRSAQPILSLADQLFRGAARGGVRSSVEHAAFDTHKPGRVELWPFLTLDTEEDSAPWDKPLDTVSAAEAEPTLARLIAARVEAMLGQPLPGRDTLIGPDDILILVRKRSPKLFHMLIAALKAQGVPVAGPDRLTLGAQIAVKDLLALLQVSIRPEDDLTLAACLRSPLFGISEAELYDLAHARRGTLLAQLEKDTRFTDTAAILKDLRNQADFLRPYEMLERILVHHDGRRRLLARLGPEAEDAIDELLNKAIAFETGSIPTLTGFLEGLDPDDVEIKREHESQAGVVRVMTVHGAKGLEAPIVIVPDTRRHTSNMKEPFIKTDRHYIWPGAHETRAVLETKAAAKQRTQEEEDRLLYVAVTRAENWLILCGAGSKPPKPEDDSWYSLCDRALDGMAHDIRPAPEGLSGQMRVLNHNWTVQTAPAAPSPDKVGIATVPPALTRPPQAAPDKRDILTPSGFEGGHALPGEGMASDDALAYGSALHRMLELLPDAPRSHWDDIVDRIARTVPDDHKVALKAEGIAVLTAPHLAPVFAPDTLSEVGITADINGQRLFGRIDRLIVSDSAVMAVDFKSNRIMPVRPEETPLALLRQMAAYHAALKTLYPDRHVEVALLWTHSATLMVLPQDLVISTQRATPHLDVGRSRS